MTPGDALRAKLGTLGHTSASQLMTLVQRAALLLDDVDPMFSTPEGRTELADRITAALDGDSGDAEAALLVEIRQALGVDNL